jgi:hypothetical protein
MLEDMTVGIRHTLPDTVCNDSPEFLNAIASILPCENVDGEDDQSSESSDEDVVWTDHHMKVTQKIWADTVSLENEPRTPQIIDCLNNLNSALPRLHKMIYSEYARPRRLAPARFQDHLCTWMEFCDVDHLVWIDKQGYPDLTVRSHLHKQHIHRSLISSDLLQDCNPEQLMDQNELISEVKRYLEQTPDSDFVPNDSTELSTDEDDIQSSDEDQNSEELSSYDDNTDSEDEQGLENYIPTGQTGHNNNISGDSDEDMEDSEGSDESSGSVDMF